MHFSTSCRTEQHSVPVPTTKFAQWPNMSFVQDRLRSGALRGFSIRASYPPIPARRDRSATAATSLKKNVAPIGTPERFAGVCKADGELDRLSAREIHPIDTP